MEPDRATARQTTDRERLVSRTHRLGVLVNAALAVLKLVVGTLAGSPALFADGLHSVSDVFMNAGAWLGSHLAARPRDADHHYGHGNIEALTTVIVGFVIVGAGVMLIAIAWQGESRLEPDLLGIAALGAEVITVAAKFGLARITNRRGRELQSSLLIAVARDNRSDIFTSLLVFVALLGSIADLRWIEPLAALCIGALIIFEGGRSIRDGINVLTDRHSDVGLTASMTERARLVDGVRSVDDIRVHPLGTHLRVDLEIGVDPDLDVATAHEIAHAVERALCSAFDHVREVAVHVNPHPTSR